MDRSTLTYLGLHYVVLIIVIFLLVVAIEGVAGTVPLWAGVVVAIVVGLAYPRVVVPLGIAPERWER